MCSNWCCWSLLGSLLLLLGRNLGFRVEIHQGWVNGTVGQSALLPVSYRCVSHFPISILWKFSNNSDPLIICTVKNCSLGAGGDPSNCSADCYRHPTYRGRAELFPHNGSLLLRDLQLSDSGVYSVTFRPPFQTRNVTLTVHEQHLTPDHPADTLEQGYLRYCAIGIFSAVSLLLLFLLFCCMRRLGLAQQKRRRIIRHQQVSSVEESQVDSAAVRDVTTFYARIGDSLEEPQLKQTPEVVYTSIASPGPQGPDTGFYHLLI